jgi:hypothetical protein
VYEDQLVSVFIRGEEVSTPILISGEHTSVGLSIEIVQITGYEILGLRIIEFIDRRET